LIFVAAIQPELPAQGAGTFHVFPQLADGVAPDGSFYTSTILTTNVTNEPATCTIRLSSSFSNRLFGNPTFRLDAMGSYALQATLSAFGSLQPLATGYATLSCDRSVTGLVGYLFLSPTGTLLSAATVFSSPATTRAQLLVNQTGGTRLALALVNDTDSPAGYQVTLSNQLGQTVASGSVQIPARSNLPKFLDEILAIPSGLSIGSVSITSSSTSFSVIGLFFNGVVFFSQPATTFSP
jgi:hypothetical protein